MSSLSVKRGKQNALRCTITKERHLEGEEQFFALFVLFALHSQKRASNVSNIISEHIEVQYKASGGCCTVALFHNSIVTQFTN